VAPDDDISPIVTSNSILGVFLYVMADQLIENKSMKIKKPLKERFFLNICVNQSEY